jgi:hypothetical protein
MSNAAANFVSTAAAAVRQRASMIGTNYTKYIPVNLFIYSPLHPLPQPTAGTAARQIPSETENAHALAKASMTVLAAGMCVY